MNINDYIKNLDVDIDSTKRMDCPVCNGKNTFTVTNNMGRLLWNCYKVSCNVGGNERINMTVDQI